MTGMCPAGNPPKIQDGSIIHFPCGFLNLLSMGLTLLPKSGQKCANPLPYLILSQKTASHCKGIVFFKGARFSRAAATWQENHLYQVKKETVGMIMKYYVNLSHARSKAAHNNLFCLPFFLYPSVSTCQIFFLIKLESVRDVDFFFFSACLLITIAFCSSITGALRNCKTNNLIV